jgi:hypothetical protein
MSSLWVKWRFSPLKYAEITISDVLGEARRAVGQYSCDARGELHGGNMYLVHTRGGPYVLCGQCCKTLGLPLPLGSRFNE